MFKIDKKTNTIYLTRGDTAPFKVDVLDEKRRKYAPCDTDTFTFTVKKNSDDTDTLIVKQSMGNASFVFEPTDTKHLSIGSYVYDVQIRFDNGAINTIIPCSVLYLCQEVGHD